MNGPEQAATVTAGRIACETFWTVIRTKDGVHADPADAWPWAAAEGAHEAWEAAATAVEARKTGSERVADFVTEVNELRGLVAEILAFIEPKGYTATSGFLADIAIWRKRAGITPVVVTAGTEHLAEKIRDLAIPDEEN